MFDANSNDAAQFIGVNPYRILKLACTIADLAEYTELQSAHLADTLQYRPKLRIE
jgi:predicted ATPase with chaperone activity